MAEGRFELGTFCDLRSWWKGVTTISARDTSSLTIWDDFYVDPWQYIDKEATTKIKTIIFHFFPPKSIAEAITLVVKF